MVNESGNDVSVINTAADTVSATIPVGNTPQSFGNFISTYTITTGVVSETIASRSLSVYPNPANTILNIHNTQSNVLPFQLNSQLIITDIMGNEVYHEMLHGIANSIAITTWNAGLYFYEIRSEHGSERGKFVKE